MATGLIGARTSENTRGANDINIPRLVDDLIEVMSPKEVPLLKLIGIDGDESTNLKREWISDELLPEKVSVISNWLAGTGTITGGTDVADSEMHAFQVGTVAKIDDELVWVSAITEGVHRECTVTRGAFGTAAANHDGSVNAKEMIIVGIAMIDGNDSPEKATTLPTFEYNYHQIFDQKYKITLRQQNTPLYGIEDDYDYQLEKCFKELAIKLELSVLHGVRHAGTASTPRTMGGFPSFLTTNVTDLNNATLEEKDFLDALQALYYKVGPENMGDLVLCGAWAKRKINGWYSPSVQMSRSESVGGVVIDKIETDFGDIGIKMLPRIPANQLYIVKLDYLKIHPYKGGRWQDRPLAANGPYDVREVYGDYTMVVKNEVAMAKIIDFSTTA
jgi:hypothetical protein